MPDFVDQTAAFYLRRDLYISAGFAPGSYYCRCAHCHETFQGDKRASACFGCATALIDRGIIAPENMPNPVAEVVERPNGMIHDLRSAAANTPYTDVRAMLLNAAAEIERLFRERGTGVPEGFWLAPIEITHWMVAAVYRSGYEFVGATADQIVELTERKISDPDAVPLAKAQYAALRAAAPQPPSVSEQIATVAAERDRLRKRLERVERLSLEPLIDGETRCMQRLISIRVELGLSADDPRIEPGFSSIEDELYTVTRERDQAREALAWYGEQARLARLIHSEGDAGRAALAADGGNRARAALSQATASGGDAES